MVSNKLLVVGSCETFICRDRLSSLLRKYATETFITELTEARTM